MNWLCLLCTRGYDFISFDRKEELQKMFRSFDTDGDNSISLDEAKLLLRDFRFSDVEIRDLMRLHDSNQDGRLQYEEFVHFWSSCGGKMPKKDQ